MLPCGFRSRDFREQSATLLDENPGHWTSGRITYQLRRLRLHGLIERREGKNLYIVTDNVYRIALWLSRCHARLLRLFVAQTLSPDSCFDQTLATAIQRFDKQIDRYLAKLKFATAA
jgi:hypothetical protein